MLKRLAYAAALTLQALGMDGAAQASLIGQTVNCFDSLTGTPGTGRFCDPGAPQQVGPGPEFELSVFAIDVGSESISLFGSRDVLAGDRFFLSLTDLIWSNEPMAIITGIANFSATGVIGIEASDVSVFDNAIVLDYGNSSWSTDSIVSFDLVTSHSQQLPEPGTLALLGFGLLGLGVAARRRSNY